MQLLSANVTIPLKNSKIENIKLPSIGFFNYLSRWNYDNCSEYYSNVAHNQPNFFFSTYWPGCPKTEIAFHQKPLNTGLGI